MKKILLLLGGTALFFTGYEIIVNSKKTPINKKQELVDWIKATKDSDETKARIASLIFNKMNEQEIKDLYYYVFTAIPQKIRLNPQSELGKRIGLITVKYNMFS